MEAGGSPTTPGRGGKHAHSTPARGGGGGSPARGRGGGGGGGAPPPTILSPLSKLGKRTPTAAASNYAAPPSTGTPTKGHSAANVAMAASPSTGLRKGAVAAAVADAENSVVAAPLAPSMR